MPQARGSRLLSPVLVLLACVAAAPCLGAGPPATAAPAGIAIAGGPAPSTVLTPDALAQLPMTQITVAFGTEHGQLQAAFDGPLLWAVLDHAGAIDATRPRDQVRETVMITGRDGYTAILALGEIAPDFENKQVILAERMNGQPLSPEHFRIVVPGDRRGGRSVRDVIGIAVAGAQPGLR